MTGKQGYDLPIKASMGISRHAYCMPTKSLAEALVRQAGQISRAAWSAAPTWLGQRTMETRLIARLGRLSRWAAGDACASKIWHALSGPRLRSGSICHPEIALNVPKYGLRLSLTLIGRRSCVFQAVSVPIGPATNSVEGSLSLRYGVLFFTLFTSIESGYCSIRSPVKWREEASSQIRQRSRLAQFLILSSGRDSALVPPARGPNTVVCLTERPFADPKGSVNASSLSPCSRRVGRADRGQVN